MVKVTYVEVPSIITENVLIVLIGLPSNGHCCLNYATSLLKMLRYLVLVTFVQKGTRYHGLTALNLAIDPWLA